MTEISPPVLPIAVNAIPTPPTPAPIDYKKVASVAYAEFAEMYGPENAVKYKDELLDVSEEANLRALGVTDEKSGMLKDKRINTVRDKMKAEKEAADRTIKAAQELAQKQEVNRKDMDAVYTKNGLTYEQGEDRIKTIIAASPKMEELIKNRPDYRNDPHWIEHMLDTNKEQKRGSGVMHSFDKSFSPGEKKKEHVFSPEVVRQAQNEYVKNYKGRLNGDLAFGRSLWAKAWKPESLK